MPQALITQAGTKFDNTAFSGAGSQLDAKINSVVNLANLNSGGELTYTWAILDQPPGATDALSSVSSPSPFFTPKKEGSYLIRLIVNQSLVTEQEDRVVLAVAQLKTRERVPAAGETTEADPSDGWATSSNSMLRRVDFLLSDPGILVGVNASGGTLTRGQIVRAPNTDVIKATLPGAETVPGFTTVSAATLSTIDELLCIVEGTPSGLPGVPGVGTAEQRMMKVRYIGRIAALPIANGPISPGEVVFVNDAGALDRLQGTIRRRVGSVQGPAPSSTMDVWFNGVGGADIDLPSITEPYVTNGPSALPNAFRIDGANAGARTAAMGPFQVHTGDAAVITMVLRRFSSVGLAIQEWQTEGGTMLARVSATGLLTLTAGLLVTSGGATITAGGLTVTAGGLTVTAGGATIVAGGVAINANDLTFSSNTQYVSWPAGMRVNTAGGSAFTFEMTSISDFAQFGTVAGTYSQLRMGTAGTESFFRNSGVGVATILGTVDSRPLDFYTSTTSRWRVASTGELQGQGGDKAIQNVLDPVNAQDAVTKNYLDRFHQNIVLNGGFDIWQRGIVSINVNENILTASLERKFWADRWAMWEDVTTPSISGTDVWTYERVAIAGDPDIEYAARVTFTVFANGTGAGGRGWLVQEVDRDLVRRLRGQKLTISFKWRKGSAMADTGVVRVVAFNGNSAFTYAGWGAGTFLESNGTSGGDPGSTGTAGYYLDGGGGVTTILDETPTNASIGTSLTAHTVTTTAIVPTDTTCLAICIGRRYITGTTPGVNNYLDLTAVQVVIGLTAPVLFRTAHDTRRAELEDCARFYERSWRQETSIGSSGNDGVHFTNVTANLHVNGQIWQVGYHPKFLVEKRTNPTITVWRVNGTGGVNQWDISGTGRVTGTSAVSPKGFLITNNTGGNVTPLGDFAAGHWEAESEI